MQLYFFQGVDPSGRTADLLMSFLLVLFLLLVTTTEEKKDVEALFQALLPFAEEGLCCFQEELFRLSQRIQGISEECGADGEVHDDSSRSFDHPEQDGNCSCSNDYVKRKHPHVNSSWYSSFLISRLLLLRT